MSKEEILKELSERCSEEQLNKILESVKSDSRRVLYEIPKILDGEYTIFTYDKTDKFFYTKDESKFIDELKNKLTKKKLGLCITLDYDSRKSAPDKDIIYPIESNIDTKIDAIMSRINEYKLDINKHLGSCIELFNKREEVMYSIDFLTKEIEDMEDKFYSQKFK